MSTEHGSKKSQGSKIFKEELTNRANGSFPTNKAFRHRVLKRMMSEVVPTVSVASAAAMYNEEKKAVEAVDSTVGLGRDPKKSA